MSPRPYQMGRRQVAAEQTRASILAAAREMLADSGGFSGFTIDAVARRAGVARMTVYYQFGSKIGLLEALGDDLAARGQIERMGEAFQQSDALPALDAFVTAFARFWGSDRLVLRRLRALAALDPDFEQVVRARDERRRRGVTALVQRLAAQLGLLTPEDIGKAIDELYTITSFETFDTLAGPSRTIDEVTPDVRRLARLVAGADGRMGGTTLTI